MAGLCTYWFRSFCISSAITVKSSKIQVLCIAFDHFAVNGPLATESKISSHFQLPGADSVAIAVRKVHFHSAASFVQICMYRLMRTNPCVPGVGSVHFRCHFCVLVGKMSPYMRNAFACTFLRSGLYEPCSGPFVTAIPMKARTYRNAARSKIRFDIELNCYT